MTPERWQRVESLFVQSVALEGAARERLLDEACADDAAVRDAVDAMLRADQGDDHIRAAVGDAARAAARDAGERWRGRTLGNYRIERQIAAGGMGSVFLAQRADEAFERDVAVKLLSSALTSEDARSRFLIERQILASLQHPNIAQLFDGGTTDDGVPYLVMEYVDGEPIDAYCDHAGLGIVDRIRLFLCVCEAVQFAHRHLVVHRDLKPGNILVTTDGVPKLLDFGIAKLLDAASANMTELLTRAESRLMTPLHASPEQLRGQPVSTASDIYSLGVLLYQLVTGQSPYRSPTRTPREIERAICETDPPLPSEAAAGAGKLRGDIDTIVMKALRKEPDQRYPTAAALAEDLRRYLAHRPIEARPASLGYRLRKLVERRGKSVAAGVAVFVLIVAMVAYHTLRLASERDLQAQQRSTAVTVSDFMVDLFRTADPQRGTAGVAASDLLQQGVERLQALREVEPLVAASLMVSMGRAYIGLADPDTAFPLIADALAIRQQLLEPGDPEIATALHFLADAELRRTNYETAESLFRKALAIREAGPGPKSLPVGETLYRLAYLHMRTGDYDSMRAAVERTLRIHEQVLGPHAAETGNVMSLLGSYHWITGDYAAARDWMETSLEIAEEQYGVDNIRIAGALHNVGLLAWQLGDYDRAQAIYSREYALRRAGLGDEHPDLALPMYGLAVTNVNMGNYDDALDWYRRTVALQEETLEPDSHYLAMTLGGYGFALLAAERFEAAGDVFGRSLDIFEQTLGADHIDLRAPLTGLAKVGVAQKRFAEASARLERALAIVEAELPPDHPDVLRTLISMGELELAAGRPDTARVLYRRGLDGLQSTLGLDHAYAEPALTGLGSILAEDGEYGPAEDYLLQALALHEAAGYADSRPPVARTLDALADVLQRTGRESEAAGYAARAARIREQRVQ